MNVVSLFSFLAQLKKSMVELQQRMIRKGKVAIMSGEIYGKEGRNFLRLNIGCSREKLIDGLKRFTLSLT